MIKFRNVGPHNIDAFQPAGGSRSQFVERGAVVEVPGTLVTSRTKPKGDEPAPSPLPDDAYIVEHNGEERAWPHAQWELVDDKPAAQAAPKKEN